MANVSSEIESGRLELEIKTALWCLFSLKVL